MVGDEILIPSSLPLTQTQSQAEIELTPENDIEVPAVWGRLYPIKIFLTPIDLIEPEFTLGRSDDCNVVLSSLNMNPKILKIVSKLHFKIFRKENDISAPVFIQDFSHNGTFINGNKIGKGKCMILQNNDEIAVGHRFTRFYVFKTIAEVTHLVPEISSKYVISKLLGTGAFGEVSLVFDKVTCERLAMKKIAKCKFTKGRAVSLNIMNEAIILKQLRHPCIISVNNIIDSKDAVYIILEFMEGGELFDRIMLGRITEETGKIFFYQIIQAVNYLHRQGIVHRDLKPENVLLSDEKTHTLIKVSDFGMSKFIDQETVLKTVCGSPMYVAPEILKTNGQSAYTSQVDIWSLGVILFFMLSSELPFPQNNPNEYILSGKYSFDSEAWQSVSESVKSLIKEFLTVEPEKRITIDEILEHEWMQDQCVIMKVAKLMQNEQLEVKQCELNDVAEPPLKKQKI